MDELLSWEKVVVWKVLCVRKLYVYIWNVQSCLMYLFVKKCVLCLF